MVGIERGEIDAHSAVVAAHSAVVAVLVALAVAFVCPVDSCNCHIYVVTYLFAERPRGAGGACGNGCVCVMDAVCARCRV